MQSQIQSELKSRNSSREIRHLYSEFLGLLAKRRDELLGVPIQSRWDLARVGADPQFNYERSIQLLDSDYIEANIYKNQRDKLLQIRSAINRMREGMYGLCEKCFAVISLSELRITPEQNYCSKCSGENSLSVL
jgi:RNA polymerase-binding transcription factor DksA